MADIEQLFPATEQSIGPGPATPVPVVADPQAPVPEQSKGVPTGWYSICGYNVVPEVVPAIVRVRYIVALAVPPVESALVSPEFRYCPRDVGSFGAAGPTVVIENVALLFEIKVAEVRVILPVAAPVGTETVAMVSVQAERDVASTPSKKVTLLFASKLPGHEPAWQK